ncbi:MAG: HigA family addiction module antitoxin [Gemmatimonadales bacterium]
MSDLTPAEVFHPGEFLRDELEARGWTQTEFAEIIGRSPRVVNEIIAGKRGISPGTAKTIAAAFGTSPQFWMNLDTAYQLAHEEAVPERVAKEARLRERFPVRELLRRGWVESTETVEVLEARVCQFYNIRSPDEEPQLAHAAKRAKSSERLNPLQLAWLFRVKQIGTAMRGLPAYSAKALREVLPQLHALMGEPEEVRHVPKLLAAAGVRLVIVEPMPSSKIDGVCLWLDARSPTIGLSLRYDRIDNFWHVLRHEIEHILRGDGQDFVDSDIDPTGSALVVETEEERIATEAALEFAVPSAELEDFIIRVHPLYSEQRVAGFARRLHVHPGIAVGRLQRRLGRFDLLRSQLVKIRHLIAPVAMTDGYGLRCPLIA